MKQATISYTKNNLCRLLELVKRGETVTILDRTKPVARLTAVAEAGASEMGKRLNELERLGVIRRGGGKLPDWILKEPPPKTKDGVSITQVLVDMRSEDR